MSATTLSPAGNQSQTEVSLTAGTQPPLAAHLVTPRRFFVHHGVYVGNGRVIHNAGLAYGLRGGAVVEVSLERFARGRGVSVQAEDSASFDPEQVVGRARSRLGEQRYHLLRNNCEHFCEWCLRGTSRSAQVESLRARPRAALTAARLAVASFCSAVVAPLRGRLPSASGLLAAQHV